MACIQDHAKRSAHFQDKNILNNIYIYMCVEFIQALLRPLLACGVQLTHARGDTHKMRKCGSAGSDTVRTAAYAAQRAHT